MHSLLVQPDNFIANLLSMTSSEETILSTETIRNELYVQGLQLNECLVDSMNVMISKNCTECYCYLMYSGLIEFVFE